LEKTTLYNFLTTRFNLILRKEENFEEKASFIVTPARIIIVLVLFAAISLTLSFFLVTTILANVFDPRMEKIQANRELISLENRVDSLIRELNNRDVYFQNIRNILGDRVIAKEETEPSTNKTAVAPININMDPTDPIDAQIRDEFEEVEIEQITYNAKQRDGLEKVFFFTPINGLVTAKFEVRKKHYGVDIVAKQNEPIKAIADGTVIIASWTQDSGYVIAVQHEHQIISIYKHNSVLLKKTGEFVKAGEIVAIIGNSGELTDGPHLHFELWHKGNPIDPQDFISF
jgi:murein DD-endopeptidase MepM/ murein hydrolase activator NlpD